MERGVVNTSEEALAEIGPERSKPTWMERQLAMPFHELADDEFEVFCFLLLKKEHPDDKVYYYGKTKDGGRDIILIKGDRTRLYSVQEIHVTCRHRRGTRRTRQALCANVFNHWIPDKPDEVYFYVVPDLTGPAADLVREQAKWRDIGPSALEEHLVEGSASRASRLCTRMVAEPRLQRCPFSDGEGEAVSRTARRVLRRSENH